MTEPLPWRGSLQDDRLQRAEQRVLERTRWSGSQAILLGTPAEGSLCKNLLREEDEGRSSLSLAKFRRDWTWECRPGQKSVLAHFFSELGAQQDSSLGQQHLAPAGRRDKARGVWWLSDQSFPLGKQRAEHWVTGGTVFHSCSATSHAQTGWDLCTSASHYGQPCQCHKWSLKTKTS